MPLNFMLSLNYNAAQLISITFITLGVISLFGNFKTKHVQVSSFSLVTKIRLKEMINHKVSVLIARS